MYCFIVLEKNKKYETSLQVLIYHFKDIAMVKFIKSMFFQFKSFWTTLQYIGILNVIENFECHGQTYKAWRRRNNKKVVFRTLKNICNRTLCENSEQMKAVDYFH